MFDASSMYASEVAIPGAARSYGTVRFIGAVSDRAAVWDGAWTSLMPPGGIVGQVLGGTEEVQVGAVNSHATLWRGMIASAVDLHPVGNFGSFALASDGTFQVGYTRPTAPSRHAMLWQGTAASAVDLNPATGGESTAYGVADGMQGGSYTPLGGFARAVLWSGTAASMQSVHPASGYVESAIQGMVTGQQVGYARVSEAPLIDHGAIWSGTAQSFIDLNPAGVTSSTLLATCGTAQVGSADGNAGIWFGSAESFLSLAQFLPPGQYINSAATCIIERDGLLYVGGYAQSPTGGVHSEAFVWIGVPAPGPAAILLAMGIFAADRRRRAHATSSPPPHS
jgi:hypothetical protein